MSEISERFHTLVTRDGGLCGENAATAFVHDARVRAALADFEALADDAKQWVITEATLSTYADGLARKHDLPISEKASQKPSIVIFKIQGVEYFGVSDGVSAFASGARGVVRLPTRHIVRSYVIE